jgi:hypothetical protein
MENEQLILYIQGNKINEWHVAQDWQKEFYHERKNLGGQGG